MEESIHKVQSKSESHLNLISHRTSTNAPT